jgi:hypothetical protein
MEDPVSFPVSAIFLFSPQGPDRLWGLPSLLTNGYCRPFPGVKQPGTEADLSPPSSAEVKNGGDIPPLPLYVFVV